jgi:hypothetical protein
LPPFPVHGAAYAVVLIRAQFDLARHPRRNTRPPLPIPSMQKRGRLVFVPA